MPSPLLGHMADALFTSISRHLSARMFANAKLGVVPCMGLLCPRCCTCNCLLTSWDFCELNSPACYQPSEQQPRPPVYWQLPAFWHHLLGEFATVIQVAGEDCHQFSSSSEHGEMPLRDQMLLFKPCSSIILNPFFKLPIQPRSAQSGYKDIVVRILWYKDIVKSLTKINTHCSSPDRQPFHFRRQLSWSGRIYLY